MNFKIKIIILTLAAVFLSAPVFLASAGVEKASAKPNILFAIADDWSFGHAGVYGCKWVKTPGMDRVARDGILFTQAFTPNGKCSPSRASIVTGRNPWQLKEAANHICYFPPEFKGWGEALAENGWFVGHTTKGWGPGVAKDAAGKPRLMTGRPFNERKATPPASGISPADYAANFEDFLAAAPAGKPWAFWYGAIEPHRGYEFGSGVAKGGRRLDEIDRVPAFWPDNETVRHDLLDYAFEVEHFDRHLGRMLESLARRGLLENTLVIFTADNGYFHAEHGLADKWYPYEESIRTPLIVRDPRMPAAQRGQTNDDLTLNVDLAPTFLAAAGIAPPARMQGRDLSSLYLASNAPAWRTEFFYEHATIKNIHFIPSSEALVRKDVKYLYWPDFQHEELFDLTADRAETHNLAATPNQATTLASLRSRFAELKAAAK